MIFLVAVIFLLIALTDYPALIKNKKWYELSILSAFFLFALVLASLQSLGVTIPSPIKGAEFIIRDVLHVTYS